MSGQGAWLLEFGSGQTGVIGERQLLHLLPAPLSLHEVPASPFFCRHVVIWEQEPVPVMALSAWLEGRPSSDEPAVVAVAAFFDTRAGENRYGALRLSAIPRRIVVSDEQACELPPDMAEWREIALSCVEHQSRALPIVNLAHVFSGGLSRPGTASSFAEALPMEAKADIPSL